MIAGTYIPGGRGGVVLRKQTQRRSQTNTATAAHTTRSRILPQLCFVLALTVTHYYCDVKQSHNTRPHDYGHCCIYYSISYTTKVYHYLFCCSRTKNRWACGISQTTQTAQTSQKAYGGESKSIRGWVKTYTGTGYVLSR